VQGRHPRSRGAAMNRSFSDRANPMRALSSAPIRRRPTIGVTGPLPALKAAGKATAHRSPLLERANVPHGPKRSARPTTVPGTNDSAWRGESDADPGQSDREGQPFLDRRQHAALELARQARDARREAGAGGRNTPRRIMTARDTAVEPSMGPITETASRVPGALSRGPGVAGRLQAETPRTAAPGTPGALLGRSLSDDWMEQCGVKAGMAARLNIFAEAWGREVEARFRALASTKGRTGKGNTIFARELKGVIEAFYPYFEALVKLLLRDAGWDMSTKLNISQVRYFLCNYMRCLTDAERGEDIMESALSLRSR